MKRGLTLLLLGALCLGLARAAYQSLTPAAPALSKFVPAGALLYLEAKDFSALVAQWNASPEKQQWLQSDNYQVFSRSRLFLRLKQAGSQFAAAAGIPADMKFLAETAGKQSVFALYDIGKLQFVYITRMAPASAMQSLLWQTRAKFETRNAGGTVFYIRKDAESGKEVAFAVSGDYLLLGTREDLLAGALQLMAGSKDRTVEDEPWWSQAVAASGGAGDLRMVLDLQKIVPSPYFRSYWAQGNVTDMKQYAAAISDLFLSGKQYREERVLLRAQAGAEAAKTAGGAEQAVAELARLVPDDAGAYRIEASPSTESSLALLESKILAPRPGPAAAQQVAPSVQLTSGEAGTSVDLETRIDQAPVRRQAESQGAAHLKALLVKNPPQAALRVQSARVQPDGVFVRIHSAVAFLGASEWDEAALRAAIAEDLAPALTAGAAGVAWQQNGAGVPQLDGLMPLLLAARGKYLVISNDAELMNAMAGRLNRKSELPPADYAAGFNHRRERQNLARLATMVDRPTVSLAPGGSPGQGREPQFLSDNIAGLSKSLAGVVSENVVVRDQGKRVLQTVSYQWSP